MKRGHSGFWHPVPRDIQDNLEAEYQRRKERRDAKVVFQFTFQINWVWNAEGFQCYSNDLPPEVGWLRRSEVHWQNQRERETTWNDYTPETAQMIELAYSSNLSEVQVLIRHPKETAYHPYRMDFKEMKQFRATDASYRRAIRRHHVQDPPNTDPVCKLWQAAKEALKELDIPKQFFSDDGNACFCRECFEGRQTVETRGGKAYAIPLGWQRFGLATNAGQCAARGVFETWHVCYHGTTQEGVRGIILGGGQLLLPGDVTFEGKPIGIHGGHIKSPFTRTNEHTKVQESFDPNQIFTSPAIEYCAFSVAGGGGERRYPYTKPALLKGEKWLIALQLRIQPDAYAVGQQTVGATAPISPLFSNSEVEWYTRRRGVHLVTGLLLCKA
eukprot:EG_transcript_8905